MLALPCGHLYQRKGAFRVKLCYDYNEKKKKFICFNEQFCINEQFIVYPYTR